MLVAKNARQAEHFQVMIRFNVINFIQKHPYYNLKNSAGTLVFDEEGISAMTVHVFLRRDVFKLKLPFPLNDKLPTIFDKQKSMSLKAFAMQALLIYSDDFNCLANLPSRAEEEMLMFYLDVFLTDVQRHQNFNNWIFDYLFKPYTELLTYRTHFDLDAVHKMLTGLRQSTGRGAAMVLAAITLQGLSEQRTITMAIGFFPEAPNPLTIAPDLEEFKNITQNPQVFPSKVQRDFLLIKYLLAKKDLSITKSYIDQIEFENLIEHDNSLCPDTNLTAILESAPLAYQRFADTEQMINKLISANRWYLLSKIAPLVPVQRLQELNGDGISAIENLKQIHRADFVVGSAWIDQAYKKLKYRFPEIFEVENVSMLGMPRK